jgi:methyl-accepting chemotaxis protein
MAELEALQEQVGSAVTDNQMDKVTQSNAANAEESASASEELSAQAEQMKSVVGELIALVGGSAGQREAASSPKAKARSTSVQQHLTHSDHAFHQIAAKTDDGIVATVSGTKTTSEKAIPLNDDDEFKEFNS